MRRFEFPFPGKTPAWEPPFQAQTFADLYGGVSRYKAASGSEVYRQEESADCLHYLEQGQIILKVASRHGKEAIIGLFGSRTFFGEECLTSWALRSSTAVCLVDGLGARIEKTSILHAIRHDPNFAGFYLRWVVSQGDALKGKLISQLTDGSERRLARILVQLASHGGEAAAGTIKGVDQETLAQMVGTTRSRVNYFMNRFRDRGYIHYDETITVHESLLQVVLGQAGSAAAANLPGSDDDDDDLAPNR